MGSFFVVQVHTGFEIEAKEMMKVVLNKMKNTSVKSIYAMETFTEVASVENLAFNLSELNAEDVSEHLHVKRIQSGLTNLRNACEGLKTCVGEDSFNLLKGYQENIRLLSKQLRDVRKSTKKISSLLNGYILVELTENVHTIPGDLWHLIKSIPKVVGFPSKNNVPQEEVDYFFQKVDVTPQVELEFDEILAYEEIALEKLQAIQNENEFVTEVQKAEIFEEMNEASTKLEKEVEEIIRETNLNAEEVDSPFLGLLNSVKVFIQRKRNRVVIHARLFNWLYPDYEKHSTTNLYSRTNFIERLRTLMTDLVGNEVAMQ